METIRQDKNTYFIGDYRVFQAVGRGGSGNTVSTINIIVTSGKFTSEAESFARGKPIRLVNGPCLLELVKQVQSCVPASNNPTTETTEPDETPFCPDCGKVMVTRIARRGKNAGNKFWGCPDYPGCKGTRRV